MSSCWFLNSFYSFVSHFKCFFNFDVTEQKLRTLLDNLTILHVSILTAVYIIYTLFLRDYLSEFEAL